MNPASVVRLLAVPLALAFVVPGCLSPIFGEKAPRFSDPLSAYGFEVPTDLSTAVPASAIDWPTFKRGDERAVLRILDHGAFNAFEEAASRFENLTGARVEHTAAKDAGSCLNEAIEDAKEPQYDILYCLDNALLMRAVDNEVLEPYTPRLAPTVEEGLVFFDADDPWPATPVDHGYIALNVDSTHGALEDTPIAGLHDARRNADLLVTEDPNFSSPGLGFFLLTVERFGETGPYTWKHYWSELFLGPDGKNLTGDEVLVTPDWSTAYEVHYSGGYGIYEEGHQGDRPIVVSYTESPAYEWYWDHVVPVAEGGGGDDHYGGDLADLPRVPLEPAGSAFHQIQTMGILRGTEDLAVAQAWIEFTLTRDFQELAAPYNAVYPVGRGVGTEGVYGDVDPAPGSFPTLEPDWDTLTEERLKRLLDEWTRLCEEHECR